MTASIEIAAGFLRQRTWLQLTLIAILYLIATIVMTWPLTANAGSAVQDPGDPLFEIWVMRAVQHQLATDPFSLYDANIFYPFDFSLAYSEEAISSALIAWPVYLVSGNQVLAYNWVLLSSFWLMGFAVYLLARELGASPGAAIIAGLIAAFFPDRYAHLSHLHLLVLGWLPLTMWAILRFQRARDRRYAGLVAIALTIQLLGSLHLAVFSTLALAVFLLFLLVVANREGLRDWRYLATLGGALAVPYVILAPTLLPHLWAGDRYGFDRSRDEVQRFAVPLDNYWSVFVSNHLLGNWLPERATAFFPGFVALVGIVLAAFAVHRWGWPLVFTLTLTLVAMIFSFGFELEIAGSTIPMPYRLVYDLIPPMRDIRGVGRFGLLTGIGFAIIAALGYTMLWRRLRARLGSFALSAGVGLTLVLSLLVGLELRSGVGISEVPDDPARLELYRWLDEQPDGPVVEFPSAGLLEGPFQPIEYMYYSTFHWKPILAGYSGYAPPAHIAILQELKGNDARPSMVTEANVGILQDLGIRYVIIHKWPEYDWQEATRIADELDQLQRVAEVGDGIVYELESGQRLEPALEVRQFPAELGAGAHFSVPIRLVNPNPNAAVVWLDGDGSIPVELIWRDSNSGESQIIETSLKIPAIAAPGTTPASVLTTAPEELGDYELRVEIGGPFAVEYSQQVALVSSVDVAGGGGAKLAMSVVNPRAASWRPGNDLAIDVTWYSLGAIDRDLTATVQLFDASGTLCGQSDVQLQSPTGGTSTWTPGTQVITRFWLQSRCGATAGEYDLLVAVYDPTQSDLPRVRLLMPDNSIATDWWVRGIEMSS